MKSLTTAAKKQITQDWAELFPGMGVYKPLHLLRRVGPLLIGIALETDSSNISYRPTFHVHSLTADFSEVSLTMSQALATVRTNAPETIDVVRHDAKFREAAERLSNQAALPLSGDLLLSTVVAAYQAYIRRPTTHYQPELYEDIALISAWLGEAEQASRVIEEATSVMQSWPQNVLEAIGGLNEWIAALRDRASKPGEIRAAVERRVEDLGVSTIARAALLRG